MKCYLESFYYNSGKASGKIYTEDEVEDLDTTPYRSNESYDRYVDIYPDPDLAEQALKDLQSA